MDTHKRALCVWHRRAGKDKLFLNKLLVRACETMANYAYYFPTARLGRRALWENVDVANKMRVIDHIPRELLAKEPNQTEMKISLINGSTIQVFGTDNLDVVGGNFFGVAFSEYALQNPLAWDLTRPILAENGGFAWFNATPRGENHLYDMLTMAQSDPDWFAQVLTVDDTGAISLADIEAERRQGMSDALIRQEFWCDFTSANENAIYGRFMSAALAEGRIGEFVVDGRVPVHTSWDLGSPQNTVVWYWQRLPFGVTRFIDCDYGLNLTLAERVHHMRQKGYNYGIHYLPHDAKQTARTGRTFEQDAREAQLGRMLIVPQVADVWNGINHAASLFGTFEFRLPACEVGVRGLKSYESAPANKQGIERRDPLATWAAHVADALRTMAEADVNGLIPRYETGEQERARPQRAIMGTRMDW
jgi:hypothetical protein